LRATPPPRAVLRCRARVGTRGSGAGRSGRPQRRVPPPRASVSEPPQIESQVFPLVDPSKGYTHISPGVCDKCITDASVRSAWIDLLIGQLPSHRSNAQRSAESADPEALVFGVDPSLLANYWRWEIAYVEFLESIRHDSELTNQTQCTLLYMVEEKERLLRSHGLDDPFVGLKQDENQVALVIYSLVAEELDALWDGDNRGSMSPEMSAMLLRTFECALAGNLFDAGAAAAVADVAFCDVDEDGQVDCKDPLRMAARDVERAHRRIREKVARPKGGTWRYDDLDNILARVEQRPWKRMLLFCDNAGADVMGMLLLARALVRVGGDDCVAVLVANSTPALNDITIAELEQFVASAAAADPLLQRMVDAGSLKCLPSGQASTLLDLSTTGPELNGWVTDEMNKVSDGEDWLLVLDGMGRSLESNWHAGRYLKPGVSAITCAMIKSQINADRLDAAVYDCVVRMTPRFEP